MSALKEKYLSTVIPELKEKLNLKNRWRLPRLVKVVVNMGTGILEKDVLETHAAELAKITGQKPCITKAKKSISNFKLREGMSIGAKVTIRGDRMYEFLERLIHSALPRIRDFRGLSLESFDGCGNYTFGVKDQTIFPEIDPDAAKVIQGMDVTIVTTTRHDGEARELLRLLGIPFALSHTQEANSG